MANIYGNFCNSCYSCDFCYYCDFCYSCDYCDFCNSCYYCNSCYSCDFCYSCYSCDSCNSCYYCNSCYSCDFCYSCNSCDFCSYSKGLRMSEHMLFCLGEGPLKSSGEGYQKHYRIFNKEVAKSDFEKALATINRKDFKLTQWIKKENMTEKEKENQPSYEIIGGFLKVLPYEAAWRKFWSEITEEERKAFLNLPNFDPAIFKEITGIDVSKDDSKKTALLSKADELIAKAEELRREADGL